MISIGNNLGLEIERWGRSHTFYENVVIYVYNNSEDDSQGIFSISRYNDGWYLYLYSNEGIFPDTFETVSDDPEVYEDDDGQLYEDYDGCDERLKITGVDII